MPGKKAAVNLSRVLNVMEAIRERQGESVSPEERTDEQEHEARSATQGANAEAKEIPSGRAVEGGQEEGAGRRQADTRAASPEQTGDASVEQLRDQLSDQFSDQQQRDAQTPAGTAPPATRQTTPATDQRSSAQSANKARRARRGPSAGATQEGRAVVASAGTDRPAGEGPATPEKRISAGRGTREHAAAAESSADERAAVEADGRSPAQEGKKGEDAPHASADEVYRYAADCLARRAAEIGEEIRKEARWQHTGWARTDTVDLAGRIAEALGWDRGVVFRVAFEVYREVAAKYGMARMRRTATADGTSVQVSALARLRAVTKPKPPGRHITVRLERNDWEHVPRLCKAHGAEYMLWDAAIGLFYAVINEGLPSGYTLAFDQTDIQEAD